MTEKMAAASVKNEHQDKIVKTARENGKRKRSNGEVVCARKA
jgi:hypothetical protein